MKRKNKNQLFISIVGTTIGVLIAFVLNNWNISRIEKNESERVLANIVNEVKLNNTLLLKSYESASKTIPSLSKLVLKYERGEKLLMTAQEMKEYQKEFPNKFFVADSIKTLTKGVWEYKGKYDFNPDIFLHFSLNESAWNSAIAVGILNNIQFEKIKPLEEVYSMQSQVKKQSEKLMDAFDIGMKQYIKVLNNLVQYEKLLIDKYERFTSNKK